VFRINWVPGVMDARVKSVVVATNPVLSGLRYTPTPDPVPLNVVVPSNVTDHDKISLAPSVPMVPSVVIVSETNQSLRRGSQGATTADNRSGRLRNVGTQPTRRPRGPGPEWRHDAPRLLFRDYDHYMFL